MSLNQTNVEIHTTHLNMRRLLILRGVAIASWLVTLLVVITTLHVHSGIWPVLLLLTGWSALSVWTWRSIHTMPVIPDSRFFLQLLLDVGILTALLYFTGGSTNPFTLLFLLPLVVAASVLSMRYIWTIALLTIAAYTLLLSHYIPFTVLDHHMEGTFNTHIMGMWWGFVISAGLIAAFAAKMGHTLRERDHIVAEAKEKALRDEQLVALGSLAAGAAHELGTPLGTIAILASDLEHDHADDPELTEKLQILRAQVRRCKETLATLSASAGQLQAASGRSQPLDQYLKNTVKHWQEMRPGILHNLQLSGHEPAPVILAEQTLTQALINILNNAADASPEDIEVYGHWEGRQLHFEVRDRGEGITEETSQKLGHSIFSTKGSENGLGLGLFLAYSVIHRLGGQVQLLNREGGGACIQVDLPLDKLIIEGEGHHE